MRTSLWMWSDGIALGFASRLTIYVVNDMSKPAATRDFYIRYWVLAALCIITAINYIQRNCLGGIETTIREAFRLPDTELTSRAMSIFFFSYALAQIPSGLLAQKWGPRVALSVYAAGWSVTTLMIALSPEIYTMIGLRFVLGAFQAGIFPCATLIMAAWLPRGRRAFASGLLTASMYGGGALVSNFTGFMLAPLGWRMLLVVYGLPGIIWAIFFYFWFRDRPEDHRAVRAGEMAVIAAGRDAPTTPTARSSPIPWLALFLSLAMWLICVQQFFRAGASRFQDMWLPTYLQEVSLTNIENLDVRKATANQLASFTGYAGMLGGLALGGFSDWVLRRTGSRRAGRNGVAVAGLFIGIAASVPLFFVNDASEQVLLVCIFSFMMSGVNSCAYAVSMDVGGKYLAVIFSTMNMIGNFGSMTLTYSLSAVKKLPGGWQASLGLFVLAQVIAMVCWLFLNPNRNIGEEQKPLATNS